MKLEITMTNAIELAILCGLRNSSPYLIDFYEIKKNNNVKFSKI